LRMYFKFKFGGTRTEKESFESRFLIIFSGGFAAVTAITWFLINDFPIRLPLQMKMPLQKIYGIFDMSSLTYPYLTWIGVFLHIFSVILFVWTHIHLGHSWSPTISVKKDQKLVTSGPFSLVRHPMYSSVALMGIGLALSTGNLLVSFPYVAVMLSTLNRIPSEEVVVKQLFGQEYVNYSKQVPSKLIPFIY